MSWRLKRAGLERSPRHLRLKSRAQKGFSLVEMLMALAVMVIMTGIVAMGVPVAWRTYTQAVNGSDAEMMLSTTISELRNELSMAKAVVKGAVDDKGNIQVRYYVSGDRYWAEIKNDPKPSKDDPDDSSKERCSVKRVLYYSGDFDFNGTDFVENITSEGEIGSETLGTSSVSENLNIRIGDITLKDGVFTVSNVKVYETGKESEAPITDISNIKIKALMLENIVG